MLFQRQSYAPLDARAGSLWHKIAGLATPKNSPRHGVENPVSKYLRKSANKTPPRGDLKFELELFNKCKQTEGDLKATSGVLLHVSYHIRLLSLVEVHRGFLLFMETNSPGIFTCSSLVLYVIRIVGFHARKGPIISALMP